ncbi:MAG: PilN domain-containing protein, partial [Chloroflexi bacterium]|nr:PilN domain-containing protein [Chloroflexota bacterium]
RFLQDVIVSELEDTLPFTKGEVDIKWQTRQGERGAEVLAIAAQSRLIDDHARILKSAQIQPLASYTRAVSLAYASGIPNAIVVHLTDEEAGIVLVRDSVPRVVHRLELTDGFDKLTTGHNGDRHDEARAIAKAVEHVDDYYHSIELRDAQASFAVVLTGDQLDTDSSLITAFEEVSSHQVRPFKPPVVYPQNLPACEYAANIGLAIADRSRARFGGRLVKAKGPSVNMLSRRHLPKPLPVMQASIVAMLILFGAAAFNFTTQVDSKTLEAATLTNQLDSLERQARQQRLSTGRISSLQGRIESADTLNAGLNTHLNALRVELDYSISRMEAITRDGLPQGVTLSNLLIQGTDITLSGSGPSYESVTQYTSNLRAFGPRLFTSVNILRVEASSSFGEERVSFQIKAGIPAGVTTGDESDGDTPDLQDLLEGLQGAGGAELLEGLGGLEGIEGLGEEGLGGLNPGQ